MLLSLKIDDNVMCNVWGQPILAAAAFPGGFLRHGRNPEEPARKPAAARIGWPHIAGRLSFPLELRNMELFGLTSEAILVLRGELQ
jgi:hypothetical protein